MFPVRFEVGFYIPEDDILHSHCRENLKAYKKRIEVAPIEQAHVKRDDEAELNELSPAFYLLNWS
jgi:hypothetical protein